MNITLTTGQNRKKSLPSHTSVIDALSEFGEFDHLPIGNGSNGSNRGEGSSEELGNTIVAARFDSTIVSLDSFLEMDGSIDVIRLNSTEGQIIYRRSLNFILSMAARQVFPDRPLIIGHSIGDSMQFSKRDDSRVSTAEMQKLKDVMLGIVQADYEIQSYPLKHSECMQYFEETGRQQSLLLLHNLNEESIRVHQCDSYIDFDFGPLLPKSSLAGNFDILCHGDGIVLLYPPLTNLSAKPRFSDITVLSDTYREHHQWAKILEVDTIGTLNRRVQQRSIKEFMRIAEALQNRKLVSIAEKIRENSDTTRLVLIAGPSSSGKTTFAKKLSIQLSSLGLKPQTLSLDDYFVSRERTPVDENGDYDFESLQAIDVPLLNSHLLKIIDGQEVEIPQFNFKTGQPEYKGHHIQLPGDGILIMEGIHGLNPDLTPRISRDRSFRIYISALTQINIDETKRISTTDNRLIRRMVRDYRYRGYSAEETLFRWPSVRRGENRNIFPFQDESDAAFNSAFDFELGVLKHQAEPLLRQIRPTSPHYAEARRLLQILSCFQPIAREFVSDDSILREFIGGSVFKY